MTISRANIARQLVPGLNAVVGLAYKRLEEEHKPLYKIETSKRAFEEEVMMTGLGPAEVKYEGEAVSYDNAQESYAVRYDHENIQLAFSITEEAFEDNLYDSFAKIRGEALGRSMAHTKQVKAAALFNNGFDSTKPIGDGAAFFSAAHPTQAGNQSNFTNTDLSETSLENALTEVQLFKDERGIYVGAQARLLVIPPQLQFTAAKILNSTLSTTTATNSTTGVTNVNDINVIKMQGLVPEGYHINRYLTDPDAWFLKTDVTNGTKMFVRKPLTTSMEGDFDTGNLRYKAQERYSFGVTDWRSFYGSSGA